VIGIAAQQSLGNMFAGIVLLLARPFRAGDHIRVRTGALGGPFEGDVLSMGLAYVTFSTEEGLTLIPNLTLLASGIVRSPRPLPDATAATASGQQPSPSTRVVPVPQPGPAASPGPAPQGSPSGPADPLPESSPSVPAPPACQPTP
jgi:hypothetical protein